MPASCAPAGRNTLGTAVDRLWRHSTLDHPDSDCDSAIRGGSYMVASNESRCQADTVGCGDYRTCAMIDNGLGAGSLHSLLDQDGLHQYKPMVFEPVQGVGTGAVHIIDICTDTVCVPTLISPLDGDYPARPRAGISLIAGDGEPVRTRDCSTVFTGNGKPMITGHRKSIVARQGHTHASCNRSAIVSGDGPTVLSCHLLFTRLFVPVSHA